jgi:ATP-binding cassette, subfamily B, bacterial PglK
MHGTEPGSVNAAAGPHASVGVVLRSVFRGPDAWALTWTLAIGVVAAIVEALGVGAVLPFMAVVLEPERLASSKAAQGVFATLGVSDPAQQLVWLGAAAAAFIALGNAASALNIVVLQRLAARTELGISRRLFAGYMARPYAFHLQRDSASLLKVINADVTSVVNNTVAPLLLVFAKGTAVLAIAALLVMANAGVAMTAAAGLALAYGGVYVAMRGRQERLGKAADTAYFERLRVSQEAIGGIKELLVLGRTQRAVAEFDRAVEARVRAYAASQSLAQLPRYVMETLAFGGILVATVALVVRTPDGARAVVPVLALYAFAAYRILPALQQVFASALTVRFNLPALRALHHDLRIVDDAPPRPAPVERTGDFAFAKGVTFEQVRFRYPGADRDALRDISLTLRPGQSVGLVGRTGSGKTTLADLLLALHEPTSGTIRVDGVPLVPATARLWQAHVGYVPQHVFLADASLTENIAFGVPREAIDHAAVEAAARAAQAWEFIAALPSGLASRAGERGVALSGGQRQRIGIARALYHRPAVLVLDEATSALDGLTEDAVMDAIASLSRDRTVILIAHRLRTIEACDRLLYLDGGSLVADGSFAELRATVPAFAAMVARQGTGAAAPLASVG